MFRAHVIIVRRSKLYYTASGVITPMGELYYTTSGIITPIGVMIPEAVYYNFGLLTMSMCARNM